MKRLLAGAALAAVAVPIVVAQNQTPTFEVGIEVINLNVSVTDGQGHYVTDLVQKDFAVYEDGVRQDLSLFTHENLPISLSIMIDTSASMDEKLSVAQAAAVRFAKTLRAQDQAQIVQFNDRATVLQDFTAEQAALESAIRRTRASGPTAMYNALYIALKDLDKLKKVGELRRRAVVLLTDGEDTASLVNDDQVLDLAKKTEVNIYSISIRQNRPTDRERLAFSQAAHVLTALANETGGQVHFPQSLSELDAVYDRIAEELRTQYSIGYVSANKRKDGKWRRIVVRVPDRESIQVRHRLGYYAAPTG